ncbi:hypothetical protein F4802DRAFT_614307 [Xylaria palmicola]|nr:hypothetical protein F4802DRAFT_614307 [Xylaria palmicola]
MGPFALSVPGYALGIHPQKRRRHDTAQHDAGSRSRSQSPSSQTDYSDGEPRSSLAPRLPSETINPLSHSPDTLRQLAVAGLSPEDELPSRSHPGFPHKPLPTRSSRRGRSGRATPSRSAYAGSDDGGSGNGSGSGAETDSTMASQRSAGKTGGIDQEPHSARVRHLNTMTAIMHRCLRDGDIARAKRAMGLLLRTRDVDVRVDNLWAIGAEILMRDGEEEEPAVTLKTPSKPRPSSSRTRAHASPRPDTDDDSYMAETAEGEGEGEEDEASTPAGHPDAPQRWGSAANVAQARLYLETLIQQHPYDAHRPHLTSAVDFWPALFGIEVHDLDAEFRRALQHIHAEYGPSSAPSSRSPSPSPSPSPSADRMDLDDDDDGRRQRSGGRGRRSGYGEGEDGGEGRDRDRHAATDALRAETQRGALGLAARMDGVLENPPYATHAELLRLRGHLALFVGDLCLPSRLAGRYASAPPVAQPASASLSAACSSLRGAERRLRAHARTTGDRVALARRREEQGRAVLFFRRALAAGGAREGWVQRLLDAEEEDDDDADDADGSLRLAGW